MPATAPPIRVVVRLPFNRPDDPLSDPPRVEWNAEKEQILWEVIAKSRAVEGAGTDWKGLAAHLEVPLPYLLYRAQTRYEEDLRGLQGIRSTLSPTSPASQAPFAVTIMPSAGTSKASNATGEYFPRLPADRPSLVRKDSGRASGTQFSSHASGRPLGVRARLSSLGNSHRGGAHLQSPTSRHTRKALSSSTLTVQGPRRTRTPLGTLTPTSSRGSPAYPASSDGSSSEEDREREEKRAEEEEALARKLKELELMMTKDALGLVSSPRPAAASPRSDRGRMRPLSASSTLPPQFDMNRRINASQTPSHHSLSSASSPQGSIPSIPSPPPESRSQPQSPMARHFSRHGKSTSPPTVSPSSAWGHTVRHGRVTRTRVAGAQVSEKGSDMGSEASSFSDLSDASVSNSALESALMSSIRGASSRFSSLAQSNLKSRRGGVRHQTS